MGWLVRNVLTLAVAVLGACGCGGCIYIPTFGIGGEGRDVSKDVGDADSKRPLRVGVSTKHDVIELLGEPTPKSDGAVESRAGDDLRELTYRWQTREGYGGMLIGPCHGLGWFMDYHSLTLHFDKRWVIDRVKWE